MRGAYGLELRGLPEAESLMQTFEEPVPALEVRVEGEEGEGRHGEIGLTATGATLPLLGGGWLELARGGEVATFHMAARPPDADLLHPYLAPAAGLYWQWARCEALHGGAFVAPAGAVIVLGSKEAGKSTTLGWLAARAGVGVLADDLVVVRSGSVLAGPRSIDLRPDAAGPLGASTVPSRQGERARLVLSAVPNVVPLAGMVLLGWSATIEVTPVPFGERMARLAPHRSIQTIPPDPVAALDLVSLPMVRAGRPRDLAQLGSFCARLLDCFD